MKIRLGYVAISLDLPKVTSSSQVTFSNYSKLPEEEREKKLNRVTMSNLIDLEIILNHNIDRNIHFYRMTSKLIPLATHPEVDYIYQERFKDFFSILGNLIRDNDIRLDTHPDQFNVVNSDNPRVVENTTKNLLHHVELFKLLDYKDGMMVIHVGSARDGKNESINRFINNFNNMPDEIKKRLMIENDDKVYTAEETLDLCEKLGLPMVLDVHHHMCNNTSDNLDKLLPRIFKTWNGRTYKPKIHISTGKEKKLDRRHSDYINADDFIDFITMAKNLDEDFDVMIEAKMKDHALIKLVEDLKSKTDYFWIDDSTFIV